MEQLIRMLHEGDYSCVIRNGEVCRTFNRRGVADIYDQLKAEPEFLCGSSVADKVVGKAAAALMVLGGVVEVYADIVSEAAAAVFEAAGVRLSYGEKVPAIINREGNGWCPLETICRDTDSPNDMLPLIDAFIKKMRV